MRTDTEVNEADTCWVASLERRQPHVLDTILSWQKQCNHDVKSLFCN